MPFSRLALTAVLGVTLAGCASMGATSSSSPLPPEPDAAKVRIQNDAWDDMTVYLAGQGMNVRLGTVTQMSQETFRIAERLLEQPKQMYLVARPTGSTRLIPVASAGQIWPGHVSEFRIDPDRYRSLSLTSAGY